MGDRLDAIPFCLWIRLFTVKTRLSFSREEIYILFLPWLFCPTNMKSNLQLWMPYPCPSTFPSILKIFLDNFAQIYLLCIQQTIHLCLFFICFSSIAAFFVVIFFYIYFWFDYAYLGFGNTPVWYSATFKILLSL